MLYECLLHPQLIMRVCYVDESGCTGTLPSASSSIQPVLIIAAIVVDEDVLAPLTRDYLALKDHYFPAKGVQRHPLESVLDEVKGAELRKEVRAGSHRNRRHALRFLDDYIALLEKHQVRIFGRIAVKGIGIPIRGTALYCSSMQAICSYYQSLLLDVTDRGFLIADGRTKNKNCDVAMSIFTQKFKRSGDTYPLLLELPTFGHSDNHVGIQLADLLCSALLFPMATNAYCLGQVRSVHVSQEYAVLRQRFGPRLANMQYKYQDATGKWRGGITVDDRLGHQSGRVLFA